MTKKTTDEARIARLTELARRVWPDTRVIAWPEHVYVEDETPVQRASLFGHPRALDALEAALLVLAEEVTLREIERAGLPQSGPWPQLRQAEAKLARLEQLAQEWEAQASAWRNNHEHHDGEDECEDACNAEAKQVERCARELRARAKGEPCE